MKGSMLPSRLPARLSLALLGALTALCVLAGASSAQTTVSLTLDDGSKNQYDLREILDDHGMEATFYVNSDAVGESSGRMTWDEIEALASDGNEIGGHTLDHSNLTAVTTGEAVHQVCDDRAILAGRGYDPVSFAYPFGAFDAKAKQIVEDCGYVSARSYTEGAPPVQGADTLPPGDLFATKTVVNVGADTDVEDMKDYVRAAEFGSGDWVQFVFHRVCESCTDDDAVQIGTFEELLDWLEPRTWLGTRVKTVREALGLGGLAAPAAPTGVQASSGGPTSARVSWTHSSSGGPAASYEVTPYVGSTPQTPRIVSDVPPDTKTLVTGLTANTTYTFRVRAVNPVGQRLAVLGVQLGDAVRRGHPGRADRRDRRAGVGLRARGMEAPVQRRPERADELHGDAVRRRRRADAGLRRRRRDRHRRRGPRRRHRLHLQGRRRERGRDRRRLAVH